MGGATQFSLNRAVHGERRRDMSGGLREGAAGGPCRQGIASLKDNKRAVAWQIGTRTAEVNSA